VMRVKMWQVSSAHQGQAFLCTTAQCCAHSCCRTRCECLFGAVLSFSPSSPLSCFCTSWPVAAVDTRQPSLRLVVSVSWRRSMRPLAGACASAYAPQSTQFGLMCGASCASVMVTALTNMLREGRAEQRWPRFSGPGGIQEALQKGCPGRGVASFRRCVIMCARSVPGRQTEREFIRI